VGDTFSDRACCSVRVAVVVYISDFWAGLLLTGARRKCRGPVGCDAIRRAAVSFFLCLWACAVVFGSILV